MTGRRVDVFYRCRECRTARKGAPGKTFCDECGGPLDSIGYAGKVGDLPPVGARQAPSRRRRRVW